MNNFVVKGAIAGVTSLGIIGVVADVIENKIGNMDNKIVEPVDNVSIIMPSLNEEKYIETAASSIRDQNIIKLYPDKFEFILADSNSIDNTVKLAKPYVDITMQVPKGKLTARNIATDLSKGNIVVSVDADAYYPDGWLNTILKPLYQPGVVAVHGSNIDYSFPVIGRLFTILHPLYIKVLSPYEMNGGNAAYYKHAFYLSGKFNENINQLDSKTIQREEEKNFGLRLSKLGKVIYKINAPKIHLGGEKVQCRYGFGNKSTCSSHQIGIQRFG